MLFCRANRMAAPRVTTFNLPKIECTWASIVCTLRPRCSAICRLVSPCASRPSTSISRLVRRPISPLVCRSSGFFGYSCAERPVSSLSTAVSSVPLLPAPVGNLRTSCVLLPAQEKEIAAVRPRRCERRLDMSGVATGYGHACVELESAGRPLYVQRTRLKWFTMASIGLAWSIPLLPCYRRVYHISSL